MLKIWTSIKSWFLQKRIKKAKTLTKELVDSEIEESQDKQVNEQNPQNKNDLKCEENILLLLSVNDKPVNSYTMQESIKNNLDLHVNGPYIRKTIATLRLKGHLIIASNRGYLLTKDKNQTNKYIQARFRELEREKVILYAMQKQI